MKKIILAAAAFLTVLSVTGCVSAGVKKAKYISIDSRGCYICQRMEKVIEEVESKYGSEVEIITTSDSSDTGEEYVKKYGINKFPANIFTDMDGKVFFRYDGLLDFKAVEEILKKKGIGLPETITQTTK
ncbi:MAG: thioredoxin family protein [Spirochaetia bacterium]|nr:thioredoxin family protein [Spirochaetia bacterium]